MRSRAALIQRWLGGQNPALQSSPAAHRPLRWAPAVSMIVTGFALGAALFALVDNAESGLEQPFTANIADGCTTLALDRSNGSTEAAPCVELAPQTPTTLRPTMLLAATAY